MTRILLSLLAMLMLQACAGISEQRTGTMTDSASVLAIVGVSVLPMTDETTVLSDQTVVIRGGRIVAIGRRTDLAVPNGAEVLDGRGHFLMPGLADMHVHLEYIEDPDVLKLFVANGVTTVRSMDGRPYILNWRDEVRSGSLVGPRIVTAGPIIDGSPPARDDNLAAPDAVAAKAAVSAQASAGYDFVKLYTNLSRDAYDGAVAEARLRKLPVAGHVPRAVPLERAIASQWSIEHLGDFASEVAAEGAPVPGWARRSLAAPLDPQRVNSLARELADRRTWVVPTLIQQDRSLAPAAKVQAWLQEPSISNLPPDVLVQWRGAVERFAGRLDADDWAILERARQNRLAILAAMHRAGVRLAIGTDTPNPFVAMGASVHQELANFVAAGLTPAQALMAATAEPARMLGIEADQGTVEVGKRADLLLLRGNPFGDIHWTANPASVLLDGSLFTSEELAVFSRALGTPEPQKPTT